MKNKFSVHRVIVTLAYHFTKRFSPLSLIVKGLLLSRFYWEHPVSHLTV